MADLYKHSGTVTIGGLIFTLLCGLVLAPILALVYAGATKFIPIIGVVNFLFLLGVTFGFCLPMVWIARLGKVRNAGAVALITLICGVFSLYLHWIAYICFIDGSFIPELLDPRVLWYVMGVLAEEGVWSFKGSTPTGWVLYLLWSLEALLYVGMPTFYVYNKMQDLPFCESCDTWTEENDGVANLTVIDNPQMLVEAIDQGHLEVFDYMYAVEGSSLKQFSAADRKKAEKALKQAKKAEDEEAKKQARKILKAMAERKYIKISSFRCPSCEDSSYISIELITIKADNEGKDTEEKNALATHLKVPPEVFAKITEAAQRAAPPVQEEGEEPEEQDEG